MVGAGGKRSNVERLVGMGKVEVVEMGLEMGRIGPEGDKKREGRV